MTKMQMWEVIVKCGLNCILILEARAALTDECFHISLDAHENNLNKVEANLKNLSIKESVVGALVSNQRHNKLMTMCTLLIMKEIKLKELSLKGDKHV